LAAKWLEKNQPVNHPDRAFHLLGLAWSNAVRKPLPSATKALSATQRADGGWSQLRANMGSDAYATGEALYALHIGGNMAVNDPIYQKGLKYLLNTQAQDGTWHVASRSIWIQPYFESGFPYGHDQWNLRRRNSVGHHALSVTVPERVTSSGN